MFSWTAFREYPIRARKTKEVKESSEVALNQSNASYSSKKRCEQVTAYLTEPFRKILNYAAPARDSAFDKSDAVEKNAAERALISASVARWKQVGYMGGSGDDEMTENVPKSRVLVRTYAKGSRNYPGGSSNKKITSDDVYSEASTDEHLSISTGSTEEMACNEEDNNRENCCRWRFG